MKFTRGAVIIVFALALAVPVGPTAAQYARETDVVPPDEDIGGGYVTPDVQRPLPRAATL